MISTMSVLTNGTMIWSDHDGRYHRENGPAIIEPNGVKEYYIHGKKHRLDGPAYIGRFGAFRWFVNNIEVTDEAIDWLATYRYRWPLNDVQCVEFKLRFCFMD